MGVLPLKGYTVVDFGQVWAGPILSGICADMGASVIRIESRAGTDALRHPDTVMTPEREALNSVFFYRNRDYYVSLNLRTPRGAQLAKEIVKLADVVVENFAPGVMAKFGLTYPELRKIKGDLVMISITAGGQNGPWSDLLGYGPAINSLAGTDGVIGYLGDRQVMANVADADQTAANIGALAVLVALYHRKKTGQGQYIDLAFLETVGSLLSEGFMEYQLTGRIPKPRGSYHPDLAPHNFYPCKGEDRWVSIAVRTEAEWRALVQALGSPPWAGDSRFGDKASRQKHIDALDARIAEWTAQQTAEEATRVLQQAGVAAAPAMTSADLYADPHNRHRRTSIQVEAPEVDAGRLLYGIPWRLTGTPGTVRRPAPSFGADSRRFFEQMLGLSADEVQGLLQDKVIY